MIRLQIYGTEASLEIRGDGQIRALIDLLEGVLEDGGNQRRDFSAHLSTQAGSGDGKLIVRAAE